MFHKTNWAKKPKYYVINKLKKKKKKKVFSALIPTFFLFVFLANTSTRPLLRESLRLCLKKKGIGARYSGSLEDKNEWCEVESKWKRKKTWGNNKRNLGLAVCPSFLIFFFVSYYHWFDKTLILTIIPFIKLGVYLKYSYTSTFIFGVFEFV